MIVTLDQIAPVTVPSDERIDWRPVRHALGLTAFGINAYVGHRAGDLVVEAHTEDGSGGYPQHEEVYVVVSGAARFVLEGAEQTVAAPAFVKPDTPLTHREAYAAADGTVVVAVGAPVDEPFTVSPWEREGLGLGAG